MGVDTNSEETMNLVHIELAKIDPSPFQTRKTFVTDDLEQSIKSNGFLGAILVRPAGKRFQIVYGERRYRSMKNLKRRRIPCIVKELNDEQAQQMLLIENLQRADLDPFEEADGIAALKRDHKLSLDELQAKLGKPRATLAQIVNLASVPQSVRKLYYDSQGSDYPLSITNLHVINRQPIDGDKLALAKWCLQARATTRHLEQYVENNYRLPLDKMFFDVADASLKRPACNECPKRAMNRREKGKTDASGDKCLDPGCFWFKNEQAVVKLAMARNAKPMSFKDAYEVLEWQGDMVSSSHRSEWAGSNETVYEDAAHRTFGKLLKDQDIQVYLFPHQ